jgi:hypothetical protein
MTLLTLIAAATPASAQTAAPMTVEGFAELPPNRIADILLPPGHPDIAHVQFGVPGPPVPNIGFIFLFTTAVPLTDDFCVQDEIETRVTPIPRPPYTVLEKLPALTAPPTHRLDYRYRPAGEGCDGAKTFFDVDGLPRDQAFAAFRIVRDAVELAKRTPHGRLPFPATYSDSLPHLVGDGAASMLAEADLGSVLEVMTPRPDSLRSYGPVARAADDKGWQFLTIEIGEIGGRDFVTINVALDNRRIARLSIERSFAVY